MASSRRSGSPTVPARVEVGNPFPYRRIGNDRQSRVAAEHRDYRSDFASEPGHRHALLHGLERRQKRDRRSANRHRCDGTRNRQSRRRSEFRRVRRTTPAVGGALQNLRTQLPRPHKRSCRSAHDRWVSKMVGGGGCRLACFGISQQWKPIKSLGGIRTFR